MKKAISFKIPKLENESIKIQEDKLNYFYDLFHFHPEYQFTIVLKGEGTFTIGENSGEFEVGNIFIIGSNVPHVFRSHRKYYESQKLISKSLSIFFKKESFGSEFFNIPETRHLGKMFSEFNRGIKIKCDSKIKKCFLNVCKLEGLERFQKFLALLQEISRNTELYYLSDDKRLIKTNELGDKRLNDVYNYVINNYQSEISLKTVSGIANLSEAAFCRYFKKRTRKTFLSFLTEFRMSVTCKLLVNKDVNVSQAAYQSGFTDLSNFNRKFKSLFGITPSEYSNRK